MTTTSFIPNFRLFGETGDFPDVIHHERIRDRALAHDWRISTHRHSEMVQILHMERGQAKVMVDDKEFHLNNNEIIYLPVMAVHSFSFRQGAEGSVFSLPLTLIRDLPAATSDLEDRLSRPIKLTVDKLLKTQLRLLKEVFEQNGTFRASLLISMGQSVLTTVAQAGARVDEEAAATIQRRLSDLDRILRSDLDANLTASDYAQRLGITAGHLNRICQAATGSSASAYIEAARMTEARRLLAFTQLSIAEVGYRLGYLDPSYFSRRFRQVVGKTPSAYRTRFLA